VEAISDRFRTAILDGHDTTVRVEVLLGGDELQIVDLSNYFTDGSLSVSRQEIRRAGSLTFVDHDSSGLIVPTGQDSLLAPFGNQLRVWSGVNYGDGTEELVCVGTLRITKATSRYPACTVDVADRAWIVSNAKLEAPYQVALGSAWDQAMLNLLGDRYPACPADIPAVDFDTLTPRVTLDEQADPWEAMQKWAASLGFALFFNTLGVATIESEVGVVVGDPVWTFDGTPNAGVPYDPTDWFNLALADEERELDSASTYNAVIISGTSSSVSTSVRGSAYDNDPASPTRYGGDFGKKPLFESNELITTSMQANRAASGRLHQVAGLAEALTVPSMFNPAFDVGDVVSVIHPGLGVNASHVLDDVSIPLRGGTQTLKTRVRQVMVSGDG
jgi:hypothetical protein